MSQDKPIDLTFEVLHKAIADNSAAFRCRRTLQPAGGPGTKVFPPTYMGAVYATEQRRIPIELDEDKRPLKYESKTCVLLDSVQSQANRMEESLQQAVDEGKLKLPLIKVDFSEFDPDPKHPDDKTRFKERIGELSSLQVPHRIADAILRDSEHEGVKFRQSEIGKTIDTAGPANATPIYKLCPTALIFGMWDSTGPKGGLGMKIERAMVSEIVGIGAEFGIRTSSRIDPLGIQKSAGPVYVLKGSKGQDWTTNVDEAEQEKGKPVPFGGNADTKKRGTPAAINHGNVVPSFSKYSKGAEGPDVMQRPQLAVDYSIRSSEGKVDAVNRFESSWPEARDGSVAPGGVTLESAEQTITLSLIALRRLRFPANGERSPEVDFVARAVLAALGLCAATLSAEKGLDLRSRCLLWPDGPMQWELLAKPGEAPQSYTLDSKGAINLLADAVAHAAKAGLKWEEKPITLKPSKSLVDLVRRSQEQAAKGENVEEEVVGSKEK